MSLHYARAYSLFIRRAAYFYSSGEQTDRCSLRTVTHCCASYRLQDGLKNAGNCVDKNGIRTDTDTISEPTWKQTYLPSELPVRI
jgi:hypothetical protein